MNLRQWLSKDKLPKHHEIVGRVGEEICLVLPELSGSGYLWNVEEINPDIISILENNVLPSVSVGGEPLIGGIIYWWNHL